MSRSLWQTHRVGFPPTVYVRSSEVGPQSMTRHLGQLFDLHETLDRNVLPLRHRSRLEPERLRELGDFAAVPRCWRWPR